MSRSKPAFFITCIISIFILSCLNIDNQEYRSVGFRVESGSNSQIVEMIQCGGTHYYLSPEGEKFHVTRKALGYYLTEGKRTTSLSFLNKDNRHIFIPIQKSDYWIGARIDHEYNYNLGYLPDPDYIVELIIFSPSTGIKLKLPLDKYFVLFPRGENKLYCQEKRTGHILSYQPRLEEGLEVKQEDGPVGELFQTAIEHKIDFITSLSSYDLNQIIEELQKEPNDRDFIASTNTGKLWFKDMFPQNLRKFIFKTENSSVLTYDEQRYIQLPMLTTISNDTVWYYVHVPSEHLGPKTMLVSFNLKNK